MPGEAFDNFSKRFIRSFDHVKQYATEAMGTAEDLTPFPPAFTQLDYKVDKIKLVFDGLLRVTKQLLHSDDYAPQINETLSEAMEKFNKKIATLRKSTDSTPSNASFSSSDSGKIPSLYQQAAAEICFEGAEILAQGDINGKSIMPSADILQRYAQIEIKLAEVRAEFNHVVTRKFMEPFSTYTGAYENANKARKAASRVRVELDAVKSRFRTASGPHQETLRRELDSLEGEFRSSCGEAISEMQTFIEYTEAAHCLEALIQAQAAYHRKAADIFAALSAS